MKDLSLFGKNYQDIVSFLKKNTSANLSEIKKGTGINARNIEELLKRGIKRGHIIRLYLGTYSASDD